jgi:hypothetical protein
MCPSIDDRRVEGLDTSAIDMQHMRASDAGDAAAHPAPPAPFHIALQRAILLDGYRAPIHGVRLVASALVLSGGRVLELSISSPLRGALLLQQIMSSCNRGRVVPGALARAESHHRRDTVMHCHIRLMYMMGNPRRGLICSLDRSPESAEFVNHLRVASRSRLQRLLPGIPGPEGAEPRQIMLCGFDDDLAAQHAEQQPHLRPAHPDPSRTGTS